MTIQKNRLYIAILVAVVASVVMRAGILNAQEMNNRITVGVAHSCVILQNGNVKCWGANDYGQLGYGDRNPRNRLPEVSLNLDRRRIATQISAGDFHTCALLDNGRIKCWGRGGNGQLGTGDSNTLSAPPDAPMRLPRIARRATQVASGGSHSCALLENGHVSCWGLGTAGQLGYGDGQTHLAPPSESINVFGDSRVAVQIAAGGAHTCALSDVGGVKCWGINREGQLGYQDRTNRLAPPEDIVSLGRNNTAIQIATGSEYTCALFDLNDLRCWGANSSGQLGYDPDQVSFLVAPSFESVYVEDTSILNFATGRQHVCILNTSRNIKCWGLGSSGQLGYGDLQSRQSIPLDPIKNLSSVSQIALGEVHTCVLLTTGNVQCWGTGSFGQLGAGSTGALLTPLNLVILNE